MSDVSTADLLEPGTPPLVFVTGPFALEASDDVAVARLASSLFAPGARRALHAAIAAGLALPDYYGHNWDALSDMLTDVDVLGVRRGFVLVVDDLPAALAADPTAFATLAALVQDAQQSLAARGRAAVVRLVAVSPAPAPEARARVSPDAWAWAEAWVATWNARELEPILEHYAEDAVFTSPLAAELVPDSGGTLRGKAALRAYWTLGLARSPGLHFRLLGVRETAQGLTLLYANHRGQEVAETMLFDAVGRVRRGIAAYTRRPA